MYRTVQYCVVLTVTLVNCTDCQVWISFETEDADSQTDDLFCASNLQSHFTFYFLLLMMGSIRLSTVHTTHQ